MLPELHRLNLFLLSICNCDTKNYNFIFYDFVYSGFLVPKQHKITIYLPIN